MIDGTGRFLPKASQGLPPLVAFCKIVGLTRLFPTGKVFSQYQLGHLPEQRPPDGRSAFRGLHVPASGPRTKMGLLDGGFFMYTGRTST